jgi:hypothetical protein
VGVGGLPLYFAAINDSSRRNGLEHAWCCVACRTFWVTSIAPALDAAVALLTVVGGLNHENKALCRGSTAVIIVMLCLQLIAILLMQPFTALFSLVAALVR